MDTRIKIEKRTVSYVSGKKVETWNEYYSCWCSVLDLIGKEKYDAYSVNLEHTLKFKCKTCNKLKDMLFEAKEYRVIWNKKTFNILFIDTMGNSAEEILLQVQKVS